MRHDSDMTPPTLGHYRLEAQIGKGGMGHVFRALDTRLNRPVAVKMMRGTEASDRPSLHRFLREARAASALNHPNIVVIHEVGETAEGDHFIVQEFIDGQTLRSRLAAPLSVEMILEIGLQIARALAAAHAVGIVHRDVKPENIMLRADGFVKVLDFGLARHVDVNAPDEVTHTQLDTDPGTVLGTPSYMSPEQARGAVSGSAADVFSLGVVLYEMACGRRPFTAPTRAGIIASVLTEEPVPLARVNPAVPRALGDLVQQMLEKDPNRRPSARDVERQLAVAQVAETTAPAAPVISTDRRTVGREAERDELRRIYARVKGGRSMILAVTGEPGIGKTSLVEDFLSDLASSGERPTIARGRCSESLAGAEAYLPILEVLDGLLHRSEGPSLNTVFRTLAPNWYMQVATHSSEASSVGQVRAASPAASQERLKRELGTLLEEATRVRPIVAFIDDLHWADVSTIDILNYLAGRFRDMRVLVVTSYRPSDMALAKHPFLGIRSNLQSHGVFQEIELQFLDLHDVERYLALQFPAHSFPPDFASIIHSKTDGSPLFMADLVRYFRDTGRIVEENGTWVLERSLSDAPRDLPESVRGMITRKIEQVDEGDRRLLAAASVQGPEFDSATLAEAVEMDPAEVEERLDVLERVHVFVTRGDEYAFPDGMPTLKYRFVHVLYQNVLYASLQPTRRAALSGRVARALVAHYGTETATIAGRLAVLFETARDLAAGAQYFFLAAKNAVALFGFREALASSERGLDLLRGLPDSPDRKQRELKLQMIRGRALRSVKGWSAPDLEVVFARARQLCQELDDPPELFPVLWSLTQFHMIRGELARCREEADALMVQAEKSGNQAFLMAAHHVSGVCREFLGDVVEASRLLERGRDLHVPSEYLTYTAMYGRDPGMAARAMSSRVLWALGYPDRALARSQETLAMARSQRVPVTLAFSLMVTEGLHLYRGEAAEAVTLGDETLELCREYELVQEAEWARTFRGSALTTLGRTREGVGQLQASLAAQQALRSGLVRSAFLALLADALRGEGRVEEALAAIDEGFAHAELTLERGFLGELHRMRGELLHLAGNQAAAEDSLRRAIDFTQQQQTKSFELRAAVALARLLLAANRPSDARAVLAPVYNWFTEGHGTRDLVAARALLSEIG